MTRPYYKLLTYQICTKCLKDVEYYFSNKTITRCVFETLMAHTHPPPPPPAMKLPFLAPLAEGQRAVVIVLCPSCVQKTSQTLLTGFLPNFTGMFLRWSSFKFLQIIVFHEEFWLPWQPK